MSAFERALAAFGCVLCVAMAVIFILLRAPVEAIFALLGALFLMRTAQDRT